MGISSLGLDHTRLLGSSVQEIAWQKAGIMKPGTPALSVPQPEGALQVLVQRARERGVSAETHARVGRACAPGDGDGLRTFVALLHIVRTV